MTKKSLLSLEVKVCMEEFSKASDTATDWLLLYLNESDKEKRAFYFLKYNEFDKKRFEYAQKLDELTHDKNR